MKFNTCIKMLMVVGAAAAVANAENGRLLAGTPMPATPVFAGTIDMGGGFGTRTFVATSIYDNDAVADGNPGVVDSTGAAADFFFAGLAAHVGDYVTTNLPRTGTGVFGDPRRSSVENVTFGISYNGPGVNQDEPVDSIHLFSDNLVTWNAAATDLTIGSFIGGFFFDSLPAADFNTSGSFYVYTTTALFSSGFVDIALDDNFLVYEHWLAVAGSTAGGAPVTDPNGITVYNGDGSADFTGQNNVGASIDLFLFDASGDDFFDANEWLFFYGGGNFAANLYLQIDVLYCDVDFDGSGFADTDDFDAFVAAFNVGC